MTEQEAPMDVCDCKIVHNDTVSMVRSQMPDEEKLFDLADLFKLFCDSTRLKIICALFSAELCVCDIADLLDMSSSAVSHQLRLLKQSRLVKSRRAGKSVFYSLDDEHVQAIFDQGMNHICEK